MSGYLEVEACLAVEASLQSELAVATSPVAKLEHIAGASDSLGIERVPWSHGLPDMSVT